MRLLIDRTGSIFLERLIHSLVFSGLARSGVFRFSGLLRFKGFPLVNEIAVERSLFGELPGIPGL